MSKAELDDLNRAGKAWRERYNPTEAVRDAGEPESSEQEDTADPRGTMGQQLELLWPPALPPSDAASRKTRSLS